ncbi:hypothetical protein NT01EI_2775 [Edwardsiella ictaluri 93-146]|uniref:Uncharacterized protein n=1 Tax=Edwardsiella ictaluri (strain 93-146) TaxID=634503 RepID=C5BAH2_EDWI9|nr:hypothetical protein NT01EI_2775 [Edwardsiella ictaluri 93-146]
MIVKPLTEVVNSSHKITKNQHIINEEILFQANFLQIE